MSNGNDSNLNTELKKTILSGIQPSGKIHLGNYFGAIQNWVKMQEEYDCYYIIVDLHSITVKQNPADLRKWTLDMAAILIACGISPEKATLFVQSHVPEHTQLLWVLSCITGMGELGRMTQFKDKSQKNPENINTGLFVYPVLQAADILLYQADLVPVGEDQKQHLELSRNLAEKFNFHYSDTFKIPEPFIPKIGARIMSLQEPTKKMSKSDENQKGTVYLTDSRDEIISKIKKSVTDSGTDVSFVDSKPGIKNLMTILSICSGKSLSEIEIDFKGKGYSEFKPFVAEALADYLEPIRNRYNDVRKDTEFLKKILSQGAEKARHIAQKTLRKVYKKTGFVQF